MLVVPDIFNYVIKHIASEGIIVNTSLSDAQAIYNVHCTNDETRCMDIMGHAQGYTASSRNKSGLGSINPDPKDLR